MSDLVAVSVVFEEETGDEVGPVAVIQLVRTAGRSTKRSTHRVMILDEGFWSQVQAVATAMLALADNMVGQEKAEAEQIVQRVLATVRSTLDLD